METRYDDDGAHSAQKIQANDTSQLSPVDLTVQNLANNYKTRICMNDDDNKYDGNGISQKIIKILNICSRVGLNPVIIGEKSDYQVWNNAANKYGFKGLIYLDNMVLEDDEFVNTDSSLKYLSTDPLVVYRRGKFVATNILKYMLNSNYLFIYDNLCLLDNGVLKKQLACKKIYELVMNNTKCRVLEVINNISIKPVQMDCYVDTLNILKTKYSAGNVSPTGMGKTIITLGAATNMNLIPFVTGTPLSLNTWEYECAKYGQQWYMGTTYHKLRIKITKEDVEKYGCTNEYGHTYILKSGNYKPVYFIYDDGEFCPSKLILDMIDMGYLFIFDEVHLAKNQDSATSQVCSALSKAVVQSGGRSRISILSATPYDKIKYSESLLRIFGIVTKEKMYHYDKSSRTFNIHGHGLHELISWSDKIDSPATSAILKEYPSRSMKKGLIISLIHRLFVDVIKHGFVTKAVAKYPTNLDIKAGYFKLSKTGLVKLKQIENDMINATNFDVTTGKLGSNIDLGKFQQAIHSMENLKIEIPSRVIPNDLDSNPNAKVILYLWHVDSIEEACHRLHKYNPKVINGSTKAHERVKIITQFQAPTNDCRLLIINIGSGSESISLDDKFGTHPRKIYIMANYYYIKEIQAVGRIQRMTSMSDGKVIIIFCESQTIEPSIYHALNNKEDVLSSVVGNSGIHKIASCEKWYEKTE